jgi:hypothetical protein
MSKDLNASRDTLFRAGQTNFRSSVENYIWKISDGNGTKGGTGELRPPREHEGQPPRLNWKTAGFGAPEMPGLIGSERGFELVNIFRESNDSSSQALGILWAFVALAGLLCPLESSSKRPR